MTYLYAGLGVAMLAGIMAIFEMGLSLTGQSLIKDGVDAYLVSDQAKALDRQVLAALASSDVEAGLEGYELCKAIYQSSSWNSWTTSGNLKPEIMSQKGEKGPCVLKLAQHLDERDGLQQTLQKQGYHQRVVVFMDDSSDAPMPYRLFSCLIPQNPPMSHLSFCEQGGTANG